ncbi:MAG: PilZ domain-containing protein [Phycisphaerales bacterium]
MSTATDRRQFPRYALNAGYAPLAIRMMDETMRRIDGMAYDLSRGGLRFEGDEAIAPGTQVALEIELPGGYGRIFAYANVVWLEDEEDPAPYKMAAVFAGFASNQDEQLLVQALAAGRFRAAA